MQLYLTLLAIFLTVFILVLTGFRVVRKKVNPTEKRISNLKKNKTWNLESKSYATSLKQDKKTSWVEKYLLQLGKLGIRDRKGGSKMREVLQEAGIHHEYAPYLLMGIKLSSGICLFFIYYLLGLRFMTEPSVAFLLALFTALLGYGIPGLMIRARIGRRQQQVGEALADALDLLVICMEAGLGLNAALLRVAQEIGLRSPVLSQELLLVTQEMRTGATREEALRNLSKRNRVENLRILVGALVLADKLGTSLADTLRAQSDSLRTRLRQSAEEQAAKAGIKMLFPLIFFIFPALFIVILGPGVISIVRIFADLTKR